MYIHCHTNLDLHHSECFPDSLPVCPQVGDHIESKMRWKNDSRIELIVVRVTWKYSDNGGWYPDVELGLPCLPHLNIPHFECWYEFIQDRLPIDIYRERREKIERKYYESYNLDGSLKTREQRQLEKDFSTTQKLYDDDDIQ